MYSIFWRSFARAVDYERVRNIRSWYADTVGLHFNPADIQSIGIGLAAFLATVLTAFVFISARHERLGRPMWITLAACTVWAWFGFLYHVVPGLSLAREMRVVSVMGIVWISMSQMNFAIAYLTERVRLGRVADAIRYFAFAVGVALTSLLFADMFGTRFIVGALLLPADIALAPSAGPLMGLLVLFFYSSIAFSAVLLAWRARESIDEADRRQAIILFVSMTVGLTLGGTRFTPWYGFDFYPLVGDIGFPLFVFATFYAIKRYHLLNREVAAAQLFIFTLWTLSFFRFLLDTTAQAMVVDGGFFLAALVLGVFLLRSVVMEAKAQRELAAIAVERTKSEFITIAAHQLRTPVAALRWSFNLLAEGREQLTEKQRVLVDKGNRAADNMMHLVNDLLDMGHIAEGRFTYVFAEGNLSDTIRAEAGLFEDIAKQKGVTLGVGVADNLPAIPFDANRLNLAIQNLVDNAVKYTARGDRVTVTAEPSGEGVRITVQDTGIGFTPDERLRVFEKFFRGTRAVHMSPDGSGLGLFIAKTIIEGHGGKLALSSEEGKGATFTVSLPPRPPSST